MGLYDARYIKLACSDLPEFTIENFDFGETLSIMINEQTQLNGLFSSIASDILDESYARRIVKRIVKAVTRTLFRFTKWISNQVKKFVLWLAEKAIDKQQEDLKKDVNDLKKNASKFALILKESVILESPTEEQIAKKNHVLRYFDSEEWLARSLAQTTNEIYNELNKYFEAVKVLIIIIIKDKQNH